MKNEVFMSTMTPVKTFTPLETFSLTHMLIEKVEKTKLFSHSPNIEDVVLRIVVLAAAIFTLLADILIHAFFALSKVLVALAVKPFNKYFPDKIPKDLSINSPLVHLISFLEHTLKILKVAGLILLDPNSAYRIAQTQGIAQDIASEKPYYDKALKEIVQQQKNPLQTAVTPKPNRTQKLGATVERNDEGKGKGEVKDEWEELDLPAPIKLQENLAATKIKAEVNAQTFNEKLDEIKKAPMDALLRLKEEISAEILDEQNHALARKVFVHREAEDAESIKLKSIKPPLRRANSYDAFPFALSKNIQDYKPASKADIVPSTKKGNVGIQVIPRFDRKALVAQRNGLHKFKKNTTDELEKKIIAIDELPDSLRFAAYGKYFVPTMIRYFKAYKDGVAFKIDYDEINEFRTEAEKEVDETTSKEIAIKKLDIYQKLCDYIKPRLDAYLQKRINSKKIQNPIEGKKDEINLENVNPNERKNDVGIEKATTEDTKIEKMKQIILKSFLDVKEKASSPENIKKTNKIITEIVGNQKSEIQDFDILLKTILSYRKKIELLKKFSMEDKTEEFNLIIEIVRAINEEYIRKVTIRDKLQKNPTKQDALKALSFLNIGEERKKAVNLLKTNEIIKTESQETIPDFNTFKNQLEIMKMRIQSGQNIELKKLKLFYVILTELNTGMHITA